MIYEDEVLNKYPEIPLIVAMADATWAGYHKTVKIEFSINEKLKKKLKELLGKEINKIFITDSDVRHIKNHHGQNEEKRGQINIYPADFAFVPVVLNEFDTAEYLMNDKKGNKKLVFTKRLNGTIYMISVERGKNQIEVLTFWKIKARSGA